MGSYQIWPCHVTQAEDLSFPYIKSYCPLNFRKSHQISWFCCIRNGNYKEDNLKEGRIPPPCGIGLNEEIFNNFFQKLYKIMTEDIQLLSDTDKIKYLFSTTDKSVINCFGKFVFDSFEKYRKHSTHIQKEN